MRKIMPIAVAIVGMLINTIYYQLYFADANYPLVLTWIMAVAFISFETTLWLNKTDYKPLKVMLVLFSILVTLSSQFTSTSQKETNAVATIATARNYDDDIAQYKLEIVNINEKLGELNKARTESFLFSKTDSDLEYYREQKTLYEGKLEQAKKDNTEAVTSSIVVKTIYDWFATGLPEVWRRGITADLVRVLFQLFSSIILALMAPVCMTMIRPETHMNRELIQRWVNYNWVGVRTGKSKTLLTESSFYQACEARKVAFSKEDYALIKKAAEKTKVIDKNGIVCENEDMAIKAIAKEL